MKTIFAMLVLTFSVSSFAKHEKLIKACQGPATELLKGAAEKVGEEIDVNTIRVNEVDARLSNPFKYVWFRANTVGTKEEFSVIMVKVIGKDCVQYSRVNIIN